MSNIDYGRRTEEDYDVVKREEKRRIYSGNRDSWVPKPRIGRSFSFKIEL